MRTDVIRVGKMVPCTTSEGPGKRFAVFTQGCAIQCKDCCNPELFSFKGGTEYSLYDFIKLVLKSKEENGIEGITYLGGEPTSQGLAVNNINKELKKYNLNVMLYSGYYLPRIKEICADVLDNLDILIDGPFEKDKIINNKRYVGSSNQKIHFLTDEFKNRMDVFNKPNTFEIKFEGNKVTLNGWANDILKVESILRKE